MQTGERPPAAFRTGSETTDALESALGDAVARPGTTGYLEALESIFFTEAALRRPSCVVQPRTDRDVSQAMRIARQCGSPVTVRGGGLSSLCTADDVVMIDPSAHMAGGSVDGDRVHVGGGATMGTMLGLLAPLSRVVPVGVVPLAGMGLATRGGIGHLTRSLGLAMDSLQEVELVVPSGEVLRLSDSSSGDEADLWWAVRGCAPSFGVVTSATFRSHRLGPVWVHRASLGLDALNAFFEVAPSLPRDTSVSAVIGPPGATQGEPVLFIYAVTTAEGRDRGEELRALIRGLVAATGTPPLWEQAGRYRYLDEMPPMSIPALDGSEPSAPSPPALGAERVFLYSKCRFLTAALDADAADIVRQRARCAPTPLCRIDFQQAGGALRDRADDATSFWGRDAEWSLPVNAVWTGAEGSRDACAGWARDTVSALDPYSIGVYSVELRPGFRETRAEVEAAFGPHLPRLRELKRRWDPGNVLGCYYPL